MDFLDPSRPLSLYIHVPFCRSKCSYCAFYSVPQTMYCPDDIGRYTERTIESIERLTDEYDRPFHTVFIGGGNPGTLGIDRIKSILDAAFVHGAPEECTSEINPENLSESFISIDAIDRISVGIQSMDGSVLRTLGRNATPEDNRRALCLLAESGKRFNADIITAVPGESIRTALDDISYIAERGAGHISYYLLTFEEGTPLSSRLRPVDEDKEIEFLREGWKHLADLGYRHYEVSNFALPGQECLHNMVYWDLGQYIGIGPGAESSIGWKRVLSLREPEDLLSYNSGLNGMAERLTEEETEEEFLLTALRKADGIEKAQYKERFGYDFDQRYADAIALLDSALYRNSGTSFSLTEDGFMLLDTVILTLSGIIC